MAACARAGDVALALVRTSDAFKNGPCPPSTPTQRPGVSPGMRPPLQLVAPREQEHLLVSRRRNVLFSLSSSMLLGTSLPVEAAGVPTGDARSPSERLMGLKSADLYYPPEFEGVWECRSVLRRVSAPQGPEKASEQLARAQKEVGENTIYRARFIPYRGHVIADREFTTRSLTEAVAPGLIVGARWSEERPDRLQLMLQGGIKVENLVTERSQVADSGMLDTTEFSQQVFDNMTVAGGPPSVKASQIRSLYTWSPSSGSKLPEEVKCTQFITMCAIPSLLSSTCQQCVHRCYFFSWAV